MNICITSPVNCKSFLLCYLWNMKHMSVFFIPALIIFLALTKCLTKLTEEERVGSF